MIRKLATVCALALFVLATASCQKLQARDNLVKGIKAFKETKFETAIKHFDLAQATGPEPGKRGTLSRHRLCPACSIQTPPAVGDNEKYANNAIQVFESVLNKDPKNTSAVAGLAGIYQGLKNLEKSREYYLKQTEIDPENPVPYYAIASTDWLRMRIKDNPLSEEQKIQAIEEGLQYVEKALEKNPNYQEAMAYKNLLLRDKAAVSKDPAEAKRLTAEADVWFNKALEALKTNAAKAAEPAK